MWKVSRSTRSFFFFEGASILSRKQSIDWSLSPAERLGKGSGPKRLMKY